MTFGDASADLTRPKYCRKKRNVPIRDRIVGMKFMLRLLVIVCLVPSALLASDWPHPRGPAADGRVEAPGTFLATKDLHGLSIP